MSEATTISGSSPAKKQQQTVALELQEVQDTVSRLASHQGVVAVLILNRQGDIVTQTGDVGAMGNPKLLTNMLQAAKVYVGSMPSHQSDEDVAHDVDQENDQDGKESGAAVEAYLSSEAVEKEKDKSISFVRIRTSKDHEILVAPKFGFTLVVLQDPNISPV